MEDAAHEEQERDFLTPSPTASPDTEVTGPLATGPEDGALEPGAAVAVARADTGVISEDSDAEAELTRVSDTFNFNNLCSCISFTYFRKNWSRLTLTIRTMNNSRMPKVVPRLRTEV